MWKYISNNSKICIHDYWIDEFILDGNDIILTLLDGFVVLKKHPLNDTGKYKQTKSAQIVLKNASLIKGEAQHIIYEKDNKYNHRNERYEEIDFTMLVDLITNSKTSLEAYDFEIKEGTFRLNGCLRQEQSYDETDLDLLFSCSEVYFCWNDYKEGSLPDFAFRD